MQDNEQQLTPDERRAVSHWVNGLGDMNRYLRSEDPNPEKSFKATKNSWKTLPMPEDHESINIGLRLTNEEMDLLSMGHIPEAMEDHWFMYCDDQGVHYHRSWTGICIFEANIVEQDGEFLIESATVNRNPEQYGSPGARYDAAFLKMLIASELGYDPGPFWEEMHAAENKRNC